MKPNFMRRVIFVYGGRVGGNQGSSLSGLFAGEEVVGLEGTMVHTSLGCRLTCGLPMLIKPSELTQAADEHTLVQGYLAHKKTPPPLGAC